MKGVGSPKLLFENLDLTPIHPTLWTGLHTEGPGRSVEYKPEWDLKALMVRQLLQIPYMKDLVKRLKRNPILRHACEYRARRLGIRIYHGVAARGLHWALRGYSY